MTVLNTPTCTANKKGSCQSSDSKRVIETPKEHWNHAYKNPDLKKLNWHESDVSPSLNLIEKSGISTGDRILHIGAGTTTLIDTLLEKGYHNMLATDISEVSLQRLQKRVGLENIETIVDDLIAPKALLDLSPVDLWIDRAVLHFFTKPEEQAQYFNLLKAKVKRGGLVIFAQFGMDSATQCCGLPILQYNNQMFEEKLGDEFQLKSTFDYMYRMPSGDTRKYIYSLYTRL